ncbi:MAG: hypothetical protein IJT02_08500 [Synergistaceae bacterium]|nr:hypothetical protein [Synergistaceae bacterium]
MRKIFVGAILAVLLCGSAGADVVYTTDAGTLGLIKISSSTSADLVGTQYTGTGSDSLLGSYWNGSETRVLVINRDSTTASGDVALTFSPSNLTTPLKSSGDILAGVHNARSMAGSNTGRSVFFASGNRISEFRTDDFSAVRSYDYTPGGSIKAVISTASRIYAIAEDEASGDVILGFDGQLKEDVQDFVKASAPEGTAALSWLSGSRAAVGHASGVSLWSSNIFTLLVSSDAPVKSLCMDDEGGFYFAEQSSSGDVYTTTLKHYSGGEVSSTLFTSTDGRGCKVFRHDSESVLAAVIGSNLRLYSMKDDALIASYDASTLGGNPLSVAASSVSGDDGSSGSSGCELSGLGVILLAGCAVIMKRR